LRKIGRVIHITPSGKALIKAEKAPKIGSTVMNETKKRVGKVFDVFGPTVSPYVEVDVKTVDPESLVNMFLYLPSSHKRIKRSRRKK